jgi:hypothetical protein
MERVVGKTQGPSRIRSKARAHCAQDATDVLFRLPAADKDKVAKCADGIPCHRYWAALTAWFGLLIGGRMLKLAFHAVMTTDAERLSDWVKMPV